MTLRVGDRIWYAHWWPGRPGGVFRAATGVVAAAAKEMATFGIAEPHYVCVVRECSACARNGGMHYIRPHELCASEDEAERAAALLSLGA